jgi:hypothetical protein
VITNKPRGMIQARSRMGPNLPNSFDQVQFVAANPGGFLSGGPTS